MNIKTLRILTLPIPFLVVLLSVGVVSSPSSRWRGVAALAMLCLLGYLLFGIFISVLQAFRRLYFGCPFCGMRSQVFSWGKRRLRLDCPECGEVAVRLGAFRFRYEKVEDENQVA